ncbi:PPE domain-containing protein [Lentzea flava]|uniref:PPE domain-containing protein n=1 Tax=Lentzea flava TaxID=103732 RepID=A0ABQ2UKQ6_9PSEU|nr:PPE domain-containing protein [Lentzea flava]MCP2200427.1 PPE family protein [Lentzea flava]GGU42660.1 hypothetical protein GCM10010178_39070 [Lentzea flava]
MAGDEPNIGGFLMLPFAGGETVYKWFEKGKGPSQSTAPTAQAWRDLAGGHNDVASLINKAVRDSGASWEGAAADTARSNTSPLATWADVTGQSATTAATTSDTIGQAYTNAKNSMSKPPEVPDKPFLNDLAWWETDYDEAVEKNQKVNEQNMRAFTQYGEAVTASTNSMPTFISPNADDANLQEQGSGKNIDGVDKPGSNKPYTPPGTGQPPGTNQPPGTPGGDDTNLSQWKPPGSGDGDTKPQWTDPNDPRNRPPGGIGDPNDPRNRPPGGDPNIPPGGRWDPNNPNDPRNRGRFDPNDPRNRPGGPGGPGRAGGPGGGPGGGGRGMGGPGGLGGAAAARGMGGPGGMGSGFGGAAGVSEQGRGGAGGFGPAGAAGAAGRGGAAGMGAGGMGAGAGKGQGDEDKEHKSASYLQETEDIFGDGTMVAPPVIGG